MRKTIKRININYDQRFEAGASGRPSWRAEKHVTHINVRDFIALPDPLDYNFTVRADYFSAEVRQTAACHEVTVSFGGEI